MVTKKEVVNINIFEIYAAKKLFFGPPVVWELEAAIDVSYSDGSSEIQYASTIDMEEAGWMVMTKRIKDVADNKNVDPYIVASWDDKSETFDSPYGKVISELDAIFKKITVC